MMIHKNIKIRGWVQGVGFRFSARERARERKLKGFVRNDPDGSLVLGGEGEEESVKEFISWCRNGPSMAEVEGGESSDGDLESFEDFEVKT